MRSGALRDHRVHHINNVIQRFVVCVQSAGELVPILNPPFNHLGDRHFRPRGLVIGLIGFRTSVRARGCRPRRATLGEYLLCGRPPRACRRTRRRSC